MELYHSRKKPDTKETTACDGSRSCENAKLFVIIALVFADLKQPRVNNVSRKEAIEELENTSAVAEAASPDVTDEVVKESTGKFQKRSAEVSSSKLLVVDFCSM